MTGGAFSAATSGERAQRVRDWLATDPGVDAMQTVYKELSAKDRGAAKALRDRLEELRRARAQDAMIEEWRAKGQALLDAERLHIADALAWQRDAAKAGAPLARPPLSDLRDRLTERVGAVEDLQQRVMVQREAAALLAQRIELLSTNSWTEAAEQQAGLESDVARWHEQSSAITADAHWSSVELRYPPQLEAAQTQLDSVWSAFNSALAQTRAAAEDASAPLPPVLVWAEELRAARGPATVPAAAAPQVSVEERAAAAKAVEAGVKLLEQAVASGHTKNTNSAAQALRRSLKTHGALIDDALAARVHQALVSAGEMSGWQRWSADQLREHLVARAEALLVPRKKRRSDAQRNGALDEAGSTAPAEAFAERGAGDAPPEQTAPESTTNASETDVAQASESVAAQAAASSEAGPASAAEPGAQPAAVPVDLVPAMGGRKLQEEIRKLRDEWKAADRGGVPNQALWRRFDRACSAAYAFVEIWLEKVRVEAAQAKAERVALIEELKAWTEAQQATPENDWKAVNRKLHGFVDRWRNGGHVGEKVYAELHGQWKAALDAAAAPLEAAQKENRQRREALIAEAQALGAAPGLNVAAIKALQQRWAEEARAVPLARKHEQKLWDAFRKPLDDAFKRRDAERDQARSALDAHDLAVLNASKALESATASGDATRIRAAMEQLEAVTQGSSVGSAAPAPVVAPAVATQAGAEHAGTTETPAPTKTAGDTGDAAKAGGQDNGAGVPVSAEAPMAETVPAEPPAAAPRKAKPVVAVRGDDRPGARKSDSRPAERGRGLPDRRDRRFENHRDRPDGRRFAERGPRPERGPRLGNEAFRAQRDAASHAQAALRELAAQAHGEALVQLLGAWQVRQADQVPEAHAFGRAVTPSLRAEWARALAAPAANAADAAAALLRLEVAADVPTPAEQIDARRALKLQLLIRRDDPSPAETWGRDTGVVLASSYDESTSQRLRAALKVLTRGSAQ